jgi:signal transduction histidine kinase
MRIDQCFAGPYASFMTGAESRRIVWVVDDSPLDAERARSALCTDHLVRVFADGSAAIEALGSAERPDVIVLDWVMPGISGVEVCRFLRSHVKRSHDIGILLLTAQRQTEQIVEGLRAGANDYLAKPFANEELLARVSALLRSQELLARAERAEAENRRLLENIPDPLLVIDVEGRLDFVNDAAAVAFDKSSGYLVGKKLGEVLPELAAITPATVSHALVDVEINGRRLSPSVRLVSSDGRTAVQLRDVTERRLLDERRLDFYSIIAHDLRTPLNSIALRVHMMKKDEHITAVPALARGVQQIDRNLQSLVSMINDFLELASLDADSRQVERAEVDLVELIRTAADDLAPLVEAKGHAFSIRVPDGADARVLGDGRRLHQAVVNLIANAIKFTPEHGEISAAVGVFETHVRIDISDNGPGLDPAVAQTLFQRFSRASKGVPGSGLGLLIVREIVEAHGGMVGIESELGRGACFWVCLPRRREPR